MERWNGGMDFFLAHFVCLFMYYNYCQEYITLKQMSTIPCMACAGCLEIYIPTIAAVCQPSSL